MYMADTLLLPMGFCQQGLSSQKSLPASDWFRITAMLPRSVRAISRVVSLVCLLSKIRNYQSPPFNGSHVLLARH